MSHYANIEVQFLDAKTLVEALVAVGVPRAHIEVHDAPQTIYDYLDQPSRYMIGHSPKDLRFAQGDKCHVIIRRQHLGGAYNDLGFYVDKASGSVAFICDYARTRTGYNDKWLGRVTQEYAAAKTKAHYAAQGKQVHRVDEKGKVYLYVKA